MSTTVSNGYRAACDRLLALRGDHEQAVAAFSWPSSGDRFNWAHDWFDSYARGNDGVALWIVEEDGSEARYSFGVMVPRSDQVARWFAAQGIGRGDRVVTMMGSQVELWESMLAVMKLGAVIMRSAPGPPAAPSAPASGPSAPRRSAPSSRLGP
jgi:acetyl-CoA synthetase